MKKIVIAAIIQATIQEEIPVCDSVKQHYQNMGCCGEGQSVCVSPHVDVTGFIEKIEAEIEPEVTVSSTTTEEVARVTVVSHNGAVFGAHVDRSECELNLPTIAQMLDGDEKSYTNLYTQMLTSYQMPFFPIGEFKNNRKLSNGVHVNTMFAAGQVKTPIASGTGTHTYSAHLIPNLRWEDGEKIVADDLIVNNRIFELFYPGKTMVGQMGSPRDVNPDFVSAYKLDSNSIAFTMKSELAPAQYDDMLANFAMYAMPHKFWEGPIAHGKAGVEAADMNKMAVFLPYRILEKRDAFSNSSDPTTIITDPIVTMIPNDHTYTSYTNTYHITATNVSIKQTYPYDAVPRADTPLAGGDEVIYGPHFSKVNWYPCLTDKAYKDHERFCWNMLSSGKIHSMGTGMTPYEPANFNYTNFDVAAELGLGNRYLAFNTEMGPYGNKYLRQAIAMSINRQSLSADVDMIDIVPQYNELDVYRSDEFKALYKPPDAGSPVAAGTGKTDAERGDLIKAHLLANGFTHDSEGFKLNGVALPTLLITAPESDPARSAVAVHMARALTASGLSAEANFMPFGEAGCSNAWYQFYPDYCAGQVLTAPAGKTFGAYIMGWGFDVKPNTGMWSDSYIVTNTDHKDEIAAKTADLDQKLVSGLGTDPATITLAHEIQDLLYDDAHYVGIYGIQERLITHKSRPLYANRPSKTMAMVADYQPAC